MNKDKKLERQPGRAWSKKLLQKKNGQSKPTEPTYKQQTIQWPYDHSRATDFNTQNNYDEI